MLRIAKGLLLLGKKESKTFWKSHNQIIGDLLKFSGRDYLWIREQVRRVDGFGTGGFWRGARVSCVR